MKINLADQAGGYWVRMKPTDLPERSYELLKNQSFRKWDGPDMLNSCADFSKAFL